MARTLDQIVSDALGQQALALLRLQADLEKAHEELKAAREELLLTKAKPVEPRES